MTLTSPEDGLETPTPSVEVSGTTDGQAAYLNVDGETTRAAADRRRLQRHGAARRWGAHASRSRSSAPTAAPASCERTVISTNLGEAVGAVERPGRGRQRPGQLRLPDQQRLQRRRVRRDPSSGSTSDGDTVNFAVTLDGEVTNPWGGNQMSVQRFDLYLRARRAPERGGAGAVRAPTPTSRRRTTSWSPPTASPGSACATPPVTPSARRTLTAIPERTRSWSSVPGDALRRDRPRGESGYALTMMSHAGDDEGAGGVRPVYDAGLLGLHRRHGHVVDPRVPLRRRARASGPETTPRRTPTPPTRTCSTSWCPTGSSQAEVLDWTAGSPVVLPYVTLDQP